jgi:D-alanine transfer protein
MFPDKDVHAHPKIAEEKFSFPAYFPNYNNDFQVEDFVFKHLKGGNTLVVIGSSEMANSEFASIPFNFYKCIGIGHDGNQCLSIFTQLCAMSNSLPNAKIAIMISPGWFCDNYADGTSLHSFLEYNDKHLLYNAYYNKALPEKYKAYIGAYLADHVNTLESPTGILKVFLYDFLSDENFKNRMLYAPFKAYYHWYCEHEISQYAKNKKEINSNLLDFCSPYTDSAISALPAMQVTKNWDSLYSKAVKEFAANSTNNNMAINNTYYSQWIKTHHMKHLRIVEDAKNQEMKDFKMLLDLIRYYNIDAYFVIPPLNPLAYDNLNELEPQINEIQQEVERNKFECYNMYVSDSNHYAKGILTDVMHLGELGWYKVDSAIYHHFYLKKHE